MERSSFQTLSWSQQGLRLLDQRQLPELQNYCLLKSMEEVAEAIRNMSVRGAPAIGVAAAYGVVLGFRQYGASVDLSPLINARPTAVNLAWAVQRMQLLINMQVNEDSLLNEAKAIHQEDVDANHHMAKLGAGLLKNKINVLTHCNAGALATSAYGTALGVIRYAFEEGKIDQVYADETRPWMQGARLTAWELLQDQIPVTLLVDSAAAWLMKQGKVDWVITGADRVAANGDVANKIGTYALALAAKAHRVNFMVVAPSSTVDLDCENGDQIAIESRPQSEILNFNDQPIAATGASAWNPVFDVTPADLISVIVTEKGVVSDLKNMAKVVGQKGE